MKNDLLHEDFFENDTGKVAKELLGKKLVRILHTWSLEGIIVETEAYYGLTDPASRAYYGLKRYNLPMWQKPGITFIYNVHKYWMLNIVAHPSKSVGAVLIRAIEPKKGIGIMRKNRPVNSIYNLTNGPGKLSVALAIKKNLSGINVTDSKSAIIILDNDLQFKLGTSHRIGVRKDVRENLRFFIENNKFVSS